MNQWEVVPTPDFVTALGKLPQSQTVADTIAELMVRLHDHAGEGEAVDGTNCWVIRSAAQGSRPGIHITYELDQESRQLRLIDVWLVPEPPRALSHPDTARA